MIRPEFTAVILAATCGSRLYPLTISGDDGDNDGNQLTGNHEEENEFENYFDSENENNQDFEKSGSKNTNESSKEDLSSSSSYLPKHLLPLAGRPLLHHLLEKLESAQLQHVIIAISSNDEVTIPSLIEVGAKTMTTTTTITTTSSSSSNIVESFELTLRKDETKNDTSKNKSKMMNSMNAMIVKVVKLSSDCSGSADALRFITSIEEKEEEGPNTADESTTHDDVEVDEENKHLANSGQRKTSGIIPHGSHVMVMSADLVLYGNLCSDDNDGGGTKDPTHSIVRDNYDDVLSSLADVHRENYHLGMISEAPPLAMTIVLTDVGECDSNGIPLKESAKAKKGGLSREDEDIEFIALSETSSAAKRIILKQAKFDVEEDEDNTGKTPKLKLPKARLHAPIHQISISKDWNDVHLYCLSPWVMKIIMNKIHLKDLAKEVVPLLIECQFKGVKTSLGIRNDDDKETKDDDEKEQLLTQLLSDAPFKKMTPLGDEDMNVEDDNTKDYPFTVLANTLSHTSSKLTLRACDVSSYAYACREVVSQAVKMNTSQDNSALSLPKEASFDTKFNSVILEDCTFGEKVQIKSSTIGKNVKMGNRCRLNNVVVMDDVVIGENCILQNSVISKGCKIEDNCNLNDCQLGPDCVVPYQTKGKGESYVKDDLVK